MVWAQSRMFFLELSQNFQNSYLKEQSYFHAVDILEKPDGLITQRLNIEYFNFSNT